MSSSPRDIKLPLQMVERMRIDHMFDLLKAPPEEAPAAKYPVRKIHIPFVRPSGSPDGIFGAQYLMHTGREHPLRREVHKLDVSDDVLQQIRHIVWADYDEPDTFKHYIVMLISHERSDGSCIGCSMSVGQLDLATAECRLKLFSHPDASYMASATADAGQTMTILSVLVDRDHCETPGACRFAHDYILETLAIMKPTEPTEPTESTEPSSVSRPEPHTDPSLDS